MKKHSFFSRGFTLVELMVTFCVICVALVISIPWFTNMITQNTLTTEMNEFIAALNFSRGEAIKRGGTVTMAVSNTAKTGWENGWQIFTDANANGMYDPPTDLLLHSHGSINSSYNINYTLRGSSNNSSFSSYISYTANGITNNVGSIALCNTSSTTPTISTARLISISALGGISQAPANANGILLYGDGSQFTSCANP